MSSSKSRQSAGRFLVGIFGSVIGAISTLFVYPYNMDLHGLSSFLLNTSMILSPIFLLGFNGVAVNNYQEFKTQDKTDHGFLGFLLLFFQKLTALLLHESLIRKYLSEKILLPLLLRYAV